MAGGTQRATSIVSFLGSVFLIFAAQVYTLWNLLDKDFASFGLRLLEEPPSTQMTGVTSDFVAPGLNHAVRVWWAWVWRHTLISLAVNLPIAFVLGVVLGILGLPKESIVRTAQAVALIVGFFVGVYVMKRILRKDFKKFRIRLVPR